MGRVNWASVFAVTFIVLSVVAMYMSRTELATAYAVLAVAAAILAHLK